MAIDAANKEWKLLINGAWVVGDNGTYPIINPATEEVVGHAPEASVTQALAAAAAAKAAFPGWSATPVAERSRLLRLVAEKLAERQPDLVPLIIAETGATAMVGSRMQVPVAVDRFNRYARDASKDIRIPLPPSVQPATPLAAGALMGAIVNRPPVGVVASISPYNFPVVNQAGKIAPALAVGCTVVMKPAPQDPLAVIMLAEILDEVGFPPGVINIINSRAPEPSAALTTTPDVDMISFTGSTSIGAVIYQAGAATMKRQLLELGGKGAGIVFGDADIAKAVAAIGSVWSFHSGQICTAPTRAIVHRSVYDHVIAGLTQYAGALKVGDPTSMETIVGPVISAVQRDRIEGYIQSAVDEGADLLVDGRRPAGLETGFYVGPTLIGGCTQGMKVVREEIFGPVVVVVPFDGDEEEAIAIANDGDFGLYDYVFSNDSEKAYPVALRQRRHQHGAAQS
jgi:acyl-CoA reductase-like NAD-dependent aldehyde dehydrogenase